MQNVIHYSQQKGRKNISNCDINLYHDKDIIRYNSKYNFYNFNNKKDVTFTLEIDLKSGNLFIQNNKNDFNYLESLTSFGFYNGGYIENFWGIRYKKNINKIFEIIKVLVLKNITDNFILKKSYETSFVNPLYDLLVDFHLFKNKIKFHNNVYFHIKEFYPKKKYLIKNDYKFLPSVLDQIGMKSKYLIGKLSDDRNKEIRIRSLLYLTKLFGDNYIDYIKKINWSGICSYTLDGKKFHRCNNDHEKKQLISLILSDNQSVDIKYVLKNIYKIFELKSYINNRGYDVSYNLKRSSRLNGFDENVMTLTLLKKHINNGYMWRYKMPEDMISYVEEPINIDGHIFVPRILKSKDDFIMEGITMKNCMEKHFFNAVVCNYISLSSDNKKINIEYHHGKILHMYGKANTPVDNEIFGAAIRVMNNRMIRCDTIPSVKEKINFLKK